MRNKERDYTLENMTGRELVLFEAVKDYATENREITERFTKRLKNASTNNARIINYYVDLTIKLIDERDSLLKLSEELKNENKKLKGD